jgi:protein SCO1/2
MTMNPAPFASLSPWRLATGLAPRLLAALAVAVLVLAACSRTEPAVKFDASDITGAKWGRDFHLVDFHGQPRSLADYRGKVVMLFFGYTNCPDECPTTLNKMAQAVDRLGPDGSRVQGLFVTIDPARDTPAVLRNYLHAFHPSFVGLTADAATIAATVKDFKVFDELHKPDAQGAYTVDHSSGIFVFDREGRLRLFMGANIWVDAMVHDLRLLLGTPARPN